jgi:Zn-dependent metalloprotease
MNAQVRAITALTMVLASGALAAQALPPAAASALPSREQSTRLIAQSLTAQRLHLGLGQADDLKPAKTFVDAKGRTVARFHQTHQGARVFGADLVASLEAPGGVQTLGRSLETRIELSAAPTLSEDQALRASHRDLLPLGPYEAQPTAELVVFPTRHAGGLRPKLDPKGDASWDREASVLAPRPAASHVWAYEVVSHLNNDQDGVRELHVVVDARTGDVLRKWDAAPSFLPKAKTRRPRTYADLEAAKAPLKVVPSPLSAFAKPSLASAPSAQAPAVPSASVPALGTGHSQYSGDVVIGTSTNPNGGFDLRDQVRAFNAANPNSVWLTTGIVTAFHDVFQSSFKPMAYTMENNAGSLDNQWGDGLNYAAPSPFLPNDSDYTPALFHWGDANGQTAAVDAHFAASMTYDMYKNILGRRSIDGNDGGIMSVVHYSAWYANAMWVDALQTMFYGDGGHPWFANDFKSLTALDIGAHEMSHGVMRNTANMEYSGESGGLNEANSDMFSQAVVGYAKRTAGDPADRIPAVPMYWTLGRDVSPEAQPMRYLFKPSLDGMSPDAWYYGMGMIDVHYSSGPGNHFFFFLSKGASTDPQSLTYSPYLPQGMTGISLDKATRIWYKALSEHFTSTTDYHAARVGCLQAATELYGAASAEYAAVENAFAAINVGAAHGMPEPIKVTFPEDLIAADSPMDLMTRGSYYEGIYSRIPIVPANNVCELRATVAHATNTSVTWKAGLTNAFFSPSGDPLDVTGTNGSFDEQGRFHSPLVAPVWCGVKATSKQDPLRFAVNMVFTAHMDADGDAEQDAQDAGILALVWNMKRAVATQISPMPDPEGVGQVDDVSVQLWLEAFKNAFAK